MNGTSLHIYMQQLQIITRKAKILVTVIVVNNNDNLGSYQNLKFS